MRPDDGNGGLPQQCHVTQNGNDRRWIVEVGQQRRVFGVADEDQPAAKFLGQLEFAFGVRDGRGDGGRSFAAGLSELRQGSERGGGRLVAVQQPAPGDRSDPFGTGKAQALNAVFGGHWAAPGEGPGRFCTGG